MDKLTKLEPRDVATVPDVEMTPGSVLGMAHAAMAGGLTAENVAVVEKMFALAERVDARQAERKFSAAFAAMQRDCRNVRATKSVDNGKFKYAPYLELWNEVRPKLEANGLSLDWTQENHGGQIKVIATLRHSGGHSIKSEYAIRVGSNAPGIPQGAQNPVLDEIAETYAKRRCLMNVANIVVDSVSAAEDVGSGAMASQEETHALFERWVALGEDTAGQQRFLKMANVDKWDSITKAALPIMQNLMTAKERQSAAKRGAA